MGLFEDSNYLKGMKGADSSIINPLLASGIGLEVGQVLIVAIHFIILFLSTTLFKVSHNNWKIFLSGASIGIATILLMNNKIW